jgi:hypothetical protein
MIVLYATLAYIPIHFLLYVVWLRRLDAFRQEKVVFRLHLFSVAVVALAALALIRSGAVDQAWAAAVAVLSLHGIYSISFLELWSLSQGGFSLNILEKAANGHGLGDPESMAALEAIGDEKRLNRLRALRSLGLIRDRPQSIALTPAGRMCRLVFRAVTWAANLRSLG